MQTNIGRLSPVPVRQEITARSRTTDNSQFVTVGRAQVPIHDIPAYISKDGVKIFGHKLDLTQRALDFCQHLKVNVAFNLSIPVKRSEIRTVVHEINTQARVALAQEVKLPPDFRLIKPQGQTIGIAGRSIRDLHRLITKARAKRTPANIKSTTEQTIADNSRPESASNANPAKPDPATATSTGGSSSLPAASAPKTDIAPAPLKGTAPEDAPSKTIADTIVPAAAKMITGRSKRVYSFEDEFRSAFPTLAGHMLLSNPDVFASRTALWQSVSEYWPDQSKFDDHLNALLADRRVYDRTEIKINVLLMTFIREFGGDKKAAGLLPEPEFVEQFQRQEALLGKCRQFARLMELYSATLNEAGHICVDREGFQRVFAKRKLKPDTIKQMLSLYSLAASPVVDGVLTPAAELVINRLKIPHKEITKIFEEELAMAPGKKRPNPARQSKMRHTSAAL